MTLEEIFINKINHQLPNFQRNPSSYQFRCPYCQMGSHHRSGRSWKNSDFRAYFYNQDNATNFKCHKCGIHRQFHRFLQDHFPNEFIEYVQEREARGTTGYQHNCPTLANALIDVGVIRFEKPDFAARKAQAQSTSTNAAPLQDSHKSPVAKSSGPAPKVTHLPRLTPQQQAGHQARLNHLMKQKEERDRQRRGELW